MNDHSLRTASKFLDSWLTYRSRQLGIPGLSVAVYAHGKLTFARAYGVADLERKQLLKPRTLFGVASQSKLFAATAVMQLVERGALQLDDTVVMHLPWLAEHHDLRVSSITVRQLLSHGAGLIRDGLDTDFWQLEKSFPTDADLRTTILEAGLALEPNTGLKYSNLGFALLGQIVAAAAGQPYADYITEHIMQPLQLEDTFADYMPELDVRLPTAYGPPFAGHRPPVRLRESTQAFASSVGVYSTPSDMCRFVAAHFRGDSRLLSAESKKEMQRPQRTADGYDAGWRAGLGFDIQSIAERQVLGHNGHLAGYMTATYFDPQTELAVSVMANSRDVPATQIVHGIFEVLDWFEQHAARSTPPSVKRLNVRLCSDLATVEVAAAADGIAFIDPDDWEPFTFAETCEQAGPDCLRITTSGSVMNEGEVLKYNFIGNKLRSVRYAGSTLLPEALYRERRGI